MERLKHYCPSPMRGYVPKKRGGGQGHSADCRIVRNPGRVQESCHVGLWCSALAAPGPRWPGGECWRRPTQICHARQLQQRRAGTGGFARFYARSSEPASCVLPAASPWSALFSSCVVLNSSTACMAHDRTAEHSLLSCVACCLSACHPFIV